MTVTDAAHVNLHHKGRGSRPVLVSRFGSSVLTHDFESVWPEVSGRLRSMLRRRGVRHHDIDEIIQETATRAISTRVSYEDADDLFRWASVVGGRLAIDLRRRGARLSDDELPDCADTVDVAAAAEHRVVLGVVKHRLRELSVHDQEALLSTFSDEPAATRRDSVRVAVARHRARNRLRILLDGLAGSSIILWIRRCRVSSAPVEAISYATAQAAACVLITIGAWTGLSDQSTNGSASQPLPVAHIVSTSPMPAAPTPSALGGTQEESGASRPTPASPRPSVPALLDTGVAVSEPNSGHSARVDSREKGESDHLWCLTPPPDAGQPTRCFDSPVKLPSTP
jgi:DNA-directed RNA polymerase specialized sigma24 family protein